MCDAFRSNTVVAEVQVGDGRVPAELLSEDGGSVSNRVPLKREGS
jgi:hypothetical protein